uniref:Uncharacterized protein n=1 Tax=Arundo donax TaxID=35708 RepID=A0A0A9FSA0_ARUDO
MPLVAKIIVFLIVRFLKTISKMSHKVFYFSS